MDSFLTDNAGVIVNNKGEMKGTGNIIANIVLLTMFKYKNLIQNNNVLFGGGKMFEEIQITEEL